MKENKSKITIKNIGIIIGFILFFSILIFIYIQSNYKQGQILSSKGKYMKKEIKEFKTQLFGENVYIFSPEDSPEEVQEVLDNLWEAQERNEFGKERYTCYFMPGKYHESISVRVGFYMQIAGLGILPSDTQINSLNCNARWLGDDSNHNATCNFWRGVENLKVKEDVMWAVSQATFMRRMELEGSLYLHDNYGWASGGFLADSTVANLTESGSQQQWFSRNSSWNAWLGENWNMVFLGIKEGKAPRGSWPGLQYTSIDKTPIIREKPYLVYDEKKGFGVFVPELMNNTSGISWLEGAAGEFFDISQFYIAKADKDTATTINNALEEGKNLILTPGIYKLEESLKVKKPETIVLGMGLPTLLPKSGNMCMEVADEEGISISGILFDAGPIKSENLLQVGEINNSEKYVDNPILLSDLFFRVGGAYDYPSQSKTCITINSNKVIGDNFWVWRADHGAEVAWNKNMAENGIIVNGNDVTLYGLFVEHFQEYQTIWNGNRGRTYFYQSEIPYDVPNQESWMSHDGKVKGYASYKVGDEVTDHEAWGLGIYSFHKDAEVDLNSAMEVPDIKGVKIHNVCTVMLTGNPGISYIINNSGNSVRSPGAREIITEYEKGIKD